jgi:hypothetical protein
MTVSARNPQQKVRVDAVMPMEVLSLYTDLIWSELAGKILAPEEGCRVFTQPAMILGHNTHRVSWNFRDCQVANSERCLT